ncbi:MAG: aggregation factor core [Boseongicola sp.]|nr:aggregation factor core [Boseongicola sp.]
MQLTAILLLFSAAPVAADVQARFIEGAPKDRFTFTASEAFCETGAVTLTVDLRSSAGALIFDVTENGAGVDVFQPLEVVAGSDALLGETTVADGDQNLTIALSALQPGAPFAFTIDVDDTLGAREITVSGSEIIGAEVTLSTNSKTRSAVFGENAQAVIDWPTCDS